MNEDEISDHIVEQFKNAQKDKVLNGKRSNTVHVSHLTIPCMRKTWYDFHQPQKPLSYTTICNFYLGTILHENISLGGRNEVPLAANIKTMKHVNVDDVGEDNFYDCLTGTADDILEIGGETVIVDKKTTNKLPDYPEEEHVTQINYYKLLLSICEGIEVKKGAVLYLDKPSSFKESKCFVFHLWSLNDIKEQVIAPREIFSCKMVPR